MTITEKEVLYIAELAKLEFDQESLFRFQKDLDNILRYAQKLNELDTTHVEPTSHVVNITCPTREDNVKNGLSHSVSMANAPEKLGSSFKVPKIIE